MQTKEQPKIDSDQQAVEFASGVGAGGEGAELSRLIVMFGNISKACRRAAETADTISSHLYHIGRACGYEAAAVHLEDSLNHLGATVPPR